MTKRERDDAVAMVQKFTASFSSDPKEGAVIPTHELTKQIAQGQLILFVDVRDHAEQAVSMIPGAVSKDVFERFMLPDLKGASPNSKGKSSPPLVVPYCTVGYRSGLYSRTLIKEHGLRNVRNGEGVIMWTFDGGRLVRPEPAPRSPSTSTALQGAYDPVCTSSATAGAAAASSTSLAARTDRTKLTTHSANAAAPAAASGSPSSSSSSGLIAPALAPENPFTGSEVMNHFAAANSGSGSFALPSGAQVTNEVHVYGKPWDCANEGYTTVYFSSSKGIWKYISSKLDNPGTLKFGAWGIVFFLFYLFFTPACGVMYDCGCRLSLSKWGQVSTCNIYDNEKDDCPWCSCQGISCILVAADSRFFKGSFLLDLLPDGTVLSIWTFLALRPIFNCIDRSNRWGSLSGLGVKALVALFWFLLYCLTMGSFFFLVIDRTYPYFWGYQRLAGQSSHSSSCPSGYCDGSNDLFINASYLNDHLTDWVVLDGRTFAEAESGGIISGAMLTPWQQLSQGGEPTEGRKSLIRPVGELQTLFALARVDGTRPVAVYGWWNAGWGEEGRLYWTLKYLGLAPRVACLHGGVAAWKKAGFSLVAPIAGTNTLPDTLPSVLPGIVPRLRLDPRLRATTELVEYITEKESSIILDVREEAEYLGAPSGDPYGAARSGHVPGAQFWNWKKNLFADGGSSSSLRTCQDILDSLPSHAEDSDIVAYCTGGIRSGFAFMILQACGLAQSRNYDGSWWAWAADSVLPCTGSGPGCSVSEGDNDDSEAMSIQGAAGGSGR